MIFDPKVDRMLAAITARRIEILLLRARRRIARQGEEHVIDPPRLEVVEAAFITDRSTEFDIIGILAFEQSVGNEDK